MTIISVQSNMNVINNKIAQSINVAGKSRHLQFKAIYNHTYLFFPCSNIIRFYSEYKVAFYIL